MWGRLPGRACQARRCGGPAVLAQAAVCPKAAPTSTCLPLLPVPLLQVRYDASEADLRQVAALFAAQLHVEGGRVADLLYVVAATEDRRRL